MSGGEWRALALFGMAMYALSFLSERAAVFTILVVGFAAFVTRSAAQSKAKG